MFAFPTTLYPILDIAVCQTAGLDPLAVGEAFIRAGAGLVQVRQKGENSRAFLEIVERLVALAAPSGTAVVVNDRTDIARIARAHGVHVGQDDLSVADVRSLLGPDAIVGVSTHDGAQLDEALETTASYVAVGPIFDTRTKHTGYAARGLDLLRLASGRGKPVVAIGGISLARVPEILAAGADAVAVITDLLSTRDPEGRARTYLRG